MSLLTAHLCSPPTQPPAPGGSLLAWPSRAPGLALRYLHGPDGLVQWVEELEAEAVLLGGPLNELAAVQQDRAHPLAHLGRLVDEQHPRLQHAPQFGPTLQGPADLGGGALPSMPARDPGASGRLGEGQIHRALGSGQSSLLVFNRNSE